MSDRRWAAGPMRRTLVGAVVTALAVAGSASAAHAQDWQSRSFSRAVSGERGLEVEVEYGAGQLRIEPAASGTLYRGAIRFDADVFEPRIGYADGRLRVGIQDGNVRGRNVKGGSLDLALTRDVPIRLDLSFGAAEANLELGGLALEDLEIATGASSTTVSFGAPNRISADAVSFDVGAAKFVVRGLGNLRARHLEVSGGVGEVDLDFSGDWSENMNAEVKMGLGKLTVRLPRGLGVSVRKGGLLASMDAQGLIKRGDVYYSEDWESAEHRLTLDIDAAFNAIQVVWMDRVAAH